MTLQQLREAVYEANVALVKKGLVTQTWGNAGQLTEAGDAFVIKPSGVPYESMRPDDMVLVDLDGRTLEGKWRPSSDTPTYVVLFRFFLDVRRLSGASNATQNADGTFPQGANPLNENGSLRGIVHTHSSYATAWAQARREIPCLGTTHADLFFGSVPLARPLTVEEVESQYEANTGRVVVEKFQSSQLNPREFPAVLTAGHGPFVWGDDVAVAVERAQALEEIAKIAYLTRSLVENSPLLEPHVLNKHYQRKHGKNAYYGQRNR